MRFLFLVSCFLFGFTPWLSAEPIRVEVVDSAGVGVVNAVLSQQSGSTPKPLDFDWDYIMAQEDRRFAPDVLIVPAGSRVSFPNRDRFRHHIYSFSKGNRFEIELYGRDETRSMVFETPGLVALGCNIHDEMAGYIHVVETDIIGQSDALGMLQLPTIKAGQGFRLWLPSRTTEWIELPAPPEASALRLVIGPPGEPPTWRPVG